MSRAEYLALYVALTTLTAFAIDGVLPAILTIERAFAPAPPHSGAQIITIFILGMALGELAIGPVSDAVGRRPAVIAGLAIFVLGTVIAATAESFAAVIIGRLLQGVGVAGPKIGTRAMIRDRYTGTDMAQVLSVIFTLLILVPMIAPAIGAAITAPAGWRGLFWAYLTLAVGLGAWFWIRHPETLPVESRVPLQPRRLASNLRMVLRRIDVTPVVIATGFVFGVQLTYFAVAADLFCVLYDVPELMPALFALLATGTGVGLMLNVRLVGRTGMVAPTLAGLLILCVSGAGLLGAAALADGHPLLEVLLGLLWLGFFALGLLFGNLNALAMRPIGHLAGLGSSIIASGSSLLAVAFASAVETVVDSPVWVLAWSFKLAALLSAFAIMLAIPGGSRRQLLRSLRTRPECRNVPRGILSRCTDIRATRLLRFPTSLRACPGSPSTSIAPIHRSSIRQNEGQVHVARGLAGPGDQGMTLAPVMGLMVEEVHIERKRQAGPLRAVTELLRRPSPSRAGGCALHPGRQARAWG